MIASDLTASSKTTVNTKTTSSVYLESTAKNHALYNNVMTEINNTYTGSGDDEFIIDLEDEDQSDEDQNDEEFEPEPNMNQNESEVIDIISDLNEIRLNPVYANDDENFQDENSGSWIITDDNEYDFRDENKKFKELSITFGESEGQKIPRFQCACHKCNLAVRKAIKSCPKMASDLVSLTKFTKNVRKSNKKSNPLKIKKCRLRCENKTRWGSSFLNLLSVYKAYKRGCQLPD